MSEETIAEVARRHILTLESFEDTYPNSGYRPKRRIRHYARCSCGWHSPLTLMAYARYAGNDHFAEVIGKSQMAKAET